jgi:ribosomal protein L30/L7E
MPGAFPAGAPTLSGDALTISRFLQSPALIARRLRDYRDLRFVSDQLLTQRFRSQGGAVLYDQSEPFVSDRPAESVAPGSEYPYANLPTGAAAIAAIQKWGEKVLLTDEEIARNALGMAAVDRQMRKVVNSVISQVDSITMSAIASAVTATFNVTGTGGGVWTGATPTILRDILRAKAAVYALNLGYVPDTVVLNDTQYAYAMTDTNITNAWRRETTDNPVYSGMVERIAGLNVVVSPNLPATTAYVLDSKSLGGMADEVDGAPGYAISDLAVQVKAIRKDEQDAYDLQGRRKTVPVVQEPGAAIKLTNVGI